MMRPRSFWHSLQSRLMLISMTATLAVLGGAGSLSTWRLHQDLVASVKDLHEEAGQQFIQDINTYQEMFNTEESLEKAIEKYSQPNLGWQVVTEAGTVLAASTNLDPSLEPTSPLQPELIKHDGRFLVLCDIPLTLANNQQVTIKSISDISDDYRAYEAFVQTLLVSGSAAVIIATVGSLMLIRRSLRPLQQMSQIVAKVSAEHLEDAELILDNSPTEVQQLAEAFEAMLNRLSMAWSQEQQLLSNISHELRTPLAIVQGYLESTLRRGTNLTEIQTESLTVSLEETQRVVRLLKDIMELTRAEAGACHLNMELVQLNDFFQDFIALAQQLGSNPIQLELPHHDIWIRVDRDRLKQVLLNLVSNAIRYSAQSAPITLRLLKQEDIAQIQVADQGIGIAAEHLPHIFDRFYCVSHSRSRCEGGTGLGLAISKTLVEQMRGRISVESQPEVGSVFTLCFPIYSLTLEAIPVSQRPLAMIER